MAELALAISIVSLIKLSNVVLTSCADYVDKVKKAPSDINKIINEVSGLEFILKRLSNLASSTDDDSRLSSLKSLHDLPMGPFHGCNEALSEMKRKLEKISGSGTMRRRLMWPFESGKLEQLLSGLEKHKSTFMLTLAGDSYVLEAATSDAIGKIGSQIEDLKLSEERKMILGWLHGTDPSTNHNAARKKHEPGTGNWLLDMGAFKNWRDEEGGILWLHGIPGAGKTVLSSLVVEHLRGQELSLGMPRPSVAYYYFDFSDHGKQTTHGCIRALVRQLFEHSATVPDQLRSLYHDKKQETPSLQELLEVFIAIVRDRQPVFIVIDALDECKGEAETERREFFDVLKEIELCADDSCKVFITSRLEPDIKIVFAELGVVEVNIDNDLVDEDIRVSLRSLLPKEPRFKKWPESVKKEIEDTLVKQSNGMFRWVACQLDALRMCVKPAIAIKQLHNLPKTLEETYTRILQRVPVDNEREMRTILILLAFSTRPMTIQEVAEATAVNLEIQTLCKDERFGDPYDILELCSSLISLADSGIDPVLRKEMNDRAAWGVDVRIVQFAHFSVKEYVLCDMARKSIPETLYINESLSQRALTEMCLIYILDFNGGERAIELDYDTHLEYPFLGYAVLHWTTHLALVPEDERDNISKMLLRLFDSNHPESLMNCLNLYNPVSIESRRFGKNNRTLDYRIQNRSRYDFESPLYYACYYSLGPVINAILGKDSGSHIPRGKELSLALEAAASGGHDDIIKRLLAEGADPNAKDCVQYFCPLQAAASSGRLSTVKLLLATGADTSPTSYGGEFGTALNVAADQGSVECLQALLDSGHELNYLNIGSEHNGTALGVGAGRGHDAVVAYLLSNGADPNICSAWDNYPLNRASEKCSFNSVKSLLDAGADVNGIGGHTSLHVASERGDIDIMRLLLQHGADINAPGGNHGTPLKGAIMCRDIAVFKFTLDNGADINCEGSTIDYPVDLAIQISNLEAVDILLSLNASFSDEALFHALGHQEVYLVKELLKRGADPNAEVKHQGHMLGWAIFNNLNEEPVRLLLEAGGDVNAIGGFYGTALQTAIACRKENIVHLLFQHGAKINIPTCGKFGNPLQAAVDCTLEKIAWLLIDKGADVHATGGKYGSIIQAAAATGNEDLVVFLISRGVDINVVGGEYGTALRAAIAMEHEVVVRLLLDAGAKVDITVEALHGTKSYDFPYAKFRSTLEVAIASCNTSILQLLFDHGMVISPEHVKDALVQAVFTVKIEKSLMMLDILASKGADVNHNGGTALLSACGRKGNIEVVRKLLSLGVPVNWSCEGTYGCALMASIGSGDAEIFEELLKAGADVNLTTVGYSGTALIAAINSGNKYLALELLKRGADPNIKAGRDGTAIVIAIKEGHEDMFYELLKGGADINLTHGYYGTVLQASISHKYYHFAHELLDLGANPVATGLHATPLICASGYGKVGQLELVERLIGLTDDLEAFDVERPEHKMLNALHNAARAGNIEVVKLLLDAGANVNAVGGSYGTALQAAVRENRREMLGLLLQQGADVNLVGGEFGTPLQAAAISGRLEFVELLLEKGADVNIEGGKYGTALQAACKTSQSTISKVLLDRGAQVNTDCGQYGNPLQAAAKSGNLNQVKSLLEHGAEINLRGGELGFALQAAVCLDYGDLLNFSVLQLLLDKGAEVNMQGGEYGTALQAAAFHNRLYVEILLKHGADPTIKGGKYGSPMEAARLKGYNRVAKLLEC